MPKQLFANDPAEGQGLGMGFIGATVDQLNSKLASAGRIVASTSTALSLTAADHAERTVFWEPNSSGAATATLPEATGSGDKYVIVNGLVQTQGTLVVAALTTDIMRGIARGSHTTAQASGGAAFLTSATSDKITLGLTTTGGLGYDKIVAQDYADGVWLVEVEYTGNGALATVFSAT